MQIKRWRRRLRLGFACLWERLRGLDFSRPDRMYDRGRGDGAMYYATPSGILSELLDRADPKRWPHFLDVGCGKGYVLRRAAERGYETVGGVEYDEKLCAAARKNMKRLGLQARVHAADAAAFEGYGDYDVFYFFNPFRAELMARVMERIVEQCRGREILILYYRPRYPEAVERFDFFKKEAVLHDPVKDYSAHVYRGCIPDGGDFCDR